MPLAGSGGQEDPWWLRARVRPQSAGAELAPTGGQPGRAGQGLVRVKGAQGWGPPGTGFWSPSSHEEAVHMCTGLNADPK